ncbi:MAG: hypothetical protein KBT19_10060 [Lachnospiraceae bacterium]|nr:hypothetical protein [Candidatus Colinaster equi]
MVNLIAFLNSFMSYLFVYFVFAACIIVAFFAGRFLRKKKDEKNSKDASEVSDDVVTQ